MHLIRYHHSALRDFSCRVLVALGVPESNAFIVGDSLLAANLRGVDSHGLQMLLPYIQQLRAGTMDGCTVGSVASESGACMTYDGNNGIGQVVADRCTEHVIRLVSGYGLSLVVARNSNHFGAAAYWDQKIARAGYIGIVMCNASPIVPPWQGKSPRLGTNPLCVAVPGSESGGWLLDMATTTVAFGKVVNAAYRNQPSIPPGWATDLDGNPTTNTQAARRGHPTPLGGYKGSGLELMVEILSGVLSGGSMSTEVGSLRGSFPSLGISYMFLAIDPNRFVGLEAFRMRMSRLVSTVKSSTPAKGYKEVLVAGEPEWRAEQERLREGIPIPASLVESLDEVAKPLGISLPSPLL